MGPRLRVGGFRLRLERLGLGGLGVWDWDKGWVDSYKTDLITIQLNTRYRIKTLFVASITF